MKKKMDLGNDKILNLLIRLSVPTIMAQLVNIMYNIVDRMFIGRLDNGEIAMAGLGVAFPIITLVSAFSSLIGSGGAPLVAMKMGKKDTEGAEEILSNSFSTLIIIAGILTIGLLIFQEPILWAFGASEATIGYSIEYLTIYLIGTIFVQISLGMNSFINTQGFTKIGMTTVMIGAIVNIVLDPIFIFGFNMGVKGAALATLCGQMVSAIWVLKFLFGKQSLLKIRKKYIIPKWKIVSAIMALGVSPFIMQATASLVTISMNNQLSRFGGDLAVSAMAIMSSIMQIVSLPMQGLSQGAQPILSYNYGAKNIKRVKDSFRLLLITCLGFSFLMWSALMLFPDIFVKIFNNDSELLSITSWSIKIYFSGIFLFGAQMACQQTFLSLGQAKISAFLALFRKVILLVPLAFILPILLPGNKLQLVLLAEPIADIISALTTSVCFYVFYKNKLMNMENEKIDFVEST